MESSLNNIKEIGKRLKISNVWFQRVIYCMGKFLWVSDIFNLRYFVLLNNIWMTMTTFFNMNYYSWIGSRFHTV